MMNLFRKNKKYIIIGFLFILVPIILVMFLFSKSYALEGFGQLNLSCDKTLAMEGESITCTLTGTVASTSQVSALSTQIKLSENLEFEEFVTDDIWIGTGEDGNVQLYTENNKSDTFNIGTFKVKVKSDIVNTVESIKLEDNVFVNENFEEETIVDTGIEVLTPQFTSNVYDLEKDYIVLEDKKIETIINSINTNGCSVVVEKDGQGLVTGEVNADTKVKIVRNDKVLKEYDIVYVGSNKYDVDKSYIIENNSDISNISSNFEVINGTISIKNEDLVISYNNTAVLSYDIIIVNSDNYDVSIDNSYIISDSSDGDTVLNNINISSNASLDYADGKVNIIYKEEVIKQLKVITISSSLYDVKLANGYVYIGSDKISSDIVKSIDSNGSLSVSDNKLKVSYNSKEIVSLDIINISSDKYILDTKDGYIYTKSVSDTKTIKENIKFVNSVLELDGNTLVLKYNDNIVDKFDIYYFETTNIIDGNTMYLRGEMEYSKFIESIVFNDLTYVVYDNSNQKLTSGTILENYSIELYRGDTKLDTYKILVEYLDVSKLKINEDNNIIYDLKVDSSYEDLISNIDTSGSISVTDSKGNNVELSSKVKTNDTLTVKLSSKTVEYKISVLGEFTNDGKISIGDVAKLYSNVKGKVTLNDAEKIAGDVTNDGKISIADVAKLYSYIKGKVSSLHKN